MKLKIQNIKLNDVVLLLEKLPLKGLKSIYRTRLIQEINEKITRVAKEEQTLIRELCHLDEKGEPKLKKDKSLDYKDKDEFDKAMNEFYRTKVVIDDGDSQVMLKSVKKSLEETDFEFEGAEAYTYLYLYDEAFEDSKEKDE